MAPRPRRWTLLGVALIVISAAHGSLAAAPTWIPGQVTITDSGLATDALRLTTLNYGTEISAEVLAVTGGVYLRDHAGLYHVPSSYADGTTDRHAYLANVIAALPENATLFFPRGTSYYKLTDSLTLAKPITLRSDGAETRQTAANKAGFVITGSNISIQGLHIAGPQSAVSKTSEDAIRIVGTSAASPAKNIEIRGNYIHSWGQHGILIKYAENIVARDNVLTGLYYAGILTLSAQRGIIAGNVIDSVTGDPNGYGIALSRHETSSLVTNPPTRDYLISNNVIRNVDIWTCIDTHGGQRITISANIVTNCPQGIAATDSDGYNDDTGLDLIAPKDITISVNIVDAGTKSDDGVDRRGDNGIILRGAESGTPGAARSLATGSIVGNVVRGYGKQSVNSGGIMARSTSGLIISGNLVQDPNPYGIVLAQDNHDFSVVGNTVVDPWTNGTTNAAGIRVSGDYNNGFLTANSVRKDAQTASKWAEYGLLVANGANNALVLGSLHSEATTALSDTGNRVAGETWHDIPTAAAGLTISAGTLALGSAVALDFATSTLGTCDSSKRGYLQSVEGAGGAADALHICQKSAADTYSWKAISTG